MICAYIHTYTHLQCILTHGFIHTRILLDVRILGENLSHIRVLPGPLCRYAATHKAIVLDWWNFSNLRYSLRVYLTRIRNTYSLGDNHLRGCDKSYDQCITFFKEMFYFIWICVLYYIHVNKRIDLSLYYWIQFMIKNHLKITYVLIFNRL